MAVVIAYHARARGAHGGFLQRGVDRRHDPKAALVSGFAEAAINDFAHFFGDIVGVDARDFAPRRDRRQRPRNGGQVFLLSNQSGRAHAAQSVALAVFGAGGRRDRIEARGRLRDADKDGDFSDGEILQFFAVIGARRGREAETAAPKIDLIHIQSEDFFFGEAALDFGRERHFDGFAKKRLLALQIKIARDLHCDCARAAFEAALRNRPHGAGERAPIDAAMRKKARVLGRQQRRHEQRRKIVVSEHAPFFFAELSHQFSLARIHAQRQPRAIIGQNIERRQFFLHHRVSDGGDEKRIKRGENAKPKYPAQQKHHFSLASLRCGQAARR